MLNWKLGCYCNNPSCEEVVLNIPLNEVAVFQSRYVFPVISGHEQENDEIIGKENGCLLIRPEAFPEYDYVAKEVEAAVERLSPIFKRRGHVWGLSGQFRVPNKEEIMEGVWGLIYSGLFCYKQEGFALLSSGGLQLVIAKDNDSKKPFISISYAIYE